LHGRPECIAASSIATQTCTPLLWPRPLLPQHLQPTTAPSVSRLFAPTCSTPAHKRPAEQHIRALEGRLSESLGQAVFRDSGLGAPDDIHSLQQALTDREQQLLELRRQLEERGEELAAARAANRELMTQLNTGQ
jgi:hypothetical protein